MKKILILFMIMVFIGSIISVAFGRTIEEEKLAVQEYIKVMDVKIIQAREEGEFAKTTMLKAQKAGAISRWNKLKASTAVAPAEAPVAAPMPAPVVAKPFASNGTFGFGLHTSFAGQYINSGIGVIKGSAGIMGNVILDDPMGIVTMVGLSADAVKFKLGAGYFYGGGLKAIPVYAGGTIYMPQWMGGQDSYVTGGLNYVIDGNGSKAGKIGGDVYFGVTADFGIGIGKTGFEIGYSVVRSDTVTSKGLSLSVSQPIVL